MVCSNPPVGALYTNVCNGVAHLTPQQCPPCYSDVHELRTYVCSTVQLLLHSATVHASLSVSVTECVCAEHQAGCVFAVVQHTTYLRIQWYGVGTCHQHASSMVHACPLQWTHTCTQRYTRYTYIAGSLVSIHSLALPECREGNCCAPLISLSPHILYQQYTVTQSHHLTTTTSRIALHCATTGQSMYVYTYILVRSTL